MSRFLIITFMLLCLTSYAGDKGVLIHNGFGTGADYLKWDSSQKRTYVMGAMNGMLLAPLFGAPKKEIVWLERFAENMTDMQIAAILTKYLEDNPGLWHDGLHTLILSAMKDAYRKSRVQE